MDAVSSLFVAIGYLVIAAIAIGTFVWWLFRAFSEEWLNAKAKFEARLAAYMDEQQKELHHMKSSVNARIDRATRLQLREFEALSESWARLMNAHSIIASATSRFRSTPDLNNMRAGQLEDFISRTNLADWERQAVRDAKDKTSEYTKRLEPHQIAHARKASDKFRQYFRKNGVFIREPIKRQFEAVYELMQAALSEHEMNLQHQTHEFKSIDRLASDGEEMVKALEAETQKVLWDFAQHQAKNPV